MQKVRMMEKLIRFIYTKSGLIICASAQVLSPTVCATGNNAMRDNNVSLNSRGFGWLKTCKMEQTHIQQAQKNCRLPCRLSHAEKTAFDGIRRSTGIKTVVFNHDMLYI